MSKVSGVTLDKLKLRADSNPELVGERAEVKASVTLAILYVIRSANCPRSDEANECTGAEQSTSVV